MTDTAKQREAWDVLQRHIGVPFDWKGRADCCAFANDVMEVFHGKDFMAEFTYSNMAEAIREIRKHGDLVGAITHVMGEPQVAQPHLMEDGDVLVARQEDGEWIAGFYLLGNMVVKTKSGVIDWPPETAVYMWRPS
jgi:Domain of unknown function (DUF6950)